MNQNTCMLCGVKFQPYNKKHVQYLCKNCIEVIELNINQGQNKGTTLGYCINSRDIVKVLKFGKIGNTCYKCGKQKQEISTSFCKECLKEHANFNCFYDILGCRNQASYYKGACSVCSECSIIEKQKFCPTCGGVLTPPASKYIKYKDYYYCSDYCSDVCVTKDTKDKILEDNSKSKKVVEDTKYIDSDKRIAIRIATEIEHSDILSLESDRFIELLAYYIGKFRQTYEDITLKKEDVIRELELTVSELKDEYGKERFKLLKLVNNLTLCPRSGKEVNSGHHVISRKYENVFGKKKIFSLTNMVMMERKAHDYIQEPNDNYIEQNLNNGMTIKQIQKQLLHYIYHGFPNDDSVKIDEERLSNIYNVLVKKGFSINDASSYSVLINDVMKNKYEV